MGKLKKSLKQLLINVCDSQRGKAKELSTIAGLSSGSALKKLLIKEQGEIENVGGLVKITQHEFKEDWKDLLHNFALEQNPEKITCKLMLEYASLYHCSELREKLTERMMDTDRNSEWAYVYDIDHKIAKREIGFVEGISLLNRRSYVTPEARVYAKFAQMYCYYDMRNIAMLQNLTDGLEEEIEEIKNGFLRESFYGRLYRISLDVALHQDKAAPLLESLFKIDNCLSPTKSIVYLQAGNFYMMKNYYKALSYYKQALDCKTEITEVQINQSINFLNCLHGKTDTYVTADRSHSNYLFYLIKSGKTKEALSVSKNMLTEKYTTHQMALHNYYLGLLHNDKTYFYKSVQLFNECGEKFYKKLAIDELKSIGEPDCVLECLLA